MWHAYEDVEDLPQSSADTFDSLWQAEEMGVETIPSRDDQKSKRQGQVLQENMKIIPMWLMCK